MEKKIKAIRIGAGVIGAMGAMFLAGAVGNADFYGAFSGGDLIRIIAGFAMLGIAIVAERLTDV